MLSLGNIGAIYIRGTQNMAVLAHGTSVIRGINTSLQSTHNTIKDGTNHMDFTIIEIKKDIVNYFILLFLTISFHL